VGVGSDVTILGGATDSEPTFHYAIGTADWLVQFFSAWIFQVSGGLSVAAGKRVILAGGALASNIVWVVSGAVSVAAGAHLEGVVLGKTSITLITGATANSRLLSQTAVALQKVCPHASRSTMLLLISCLGHCHQLIYLVNHIPPFMQPQK
jgi:hypothetical protein